MFMNEVYSDPQYKAAKFLGKYLMLAVFIIGTVGNLLSFLVMVRKRMRSSTTAFYMACLAVADTLVLLTGCLRRWILEVFEVDLLNVNTVACHSVNFLQYLSFDIATWILVAMTIDRVVVVTNPLKAYRYSTRARAAASIVILIVLFVGLNSHFFFTTEHNERNICTAAEQYREFYVAIWSWIDAVVYSFLPFTLLLLLNIIIIVSIMKANGRKRKMSSQFQNRRKSEQSHTLKTSRLTAMLLSITFAFILLTAPSMIVHIIREQAIFDQSQPSNVAKYILTRQVLRLTLYLNHSINFFLYCVAGTKFRRELAAMICCPRVDSQHHKYVTRTSMASISAYGATSQSMPQSETVDSVVNVV